MRLLAQVAEAVQHSHGKAILHRDLKPANILLEGDPEGPLDKLVPFVTDFGLAKRLEGEVEITKANALLGTPAYMAPEQAAGQTHLVAVTTDVYAMGAILYTLLTGKPPFQEPMLARLLVSVQQDEPARMRGLNRAVPRDLETICAKAMQKDPAKRYAAAADLAADLHRFLDNKPIAARPVGAWERTAKWTRRHPVPAALTVLLFLVASLGMAMVLWQWRDAESERTRADAKAVAEADANRRAQEALAKVRLSNYFSAVARADLEFRANNIIAAEQALEGCDPDLRAWEWRYVKALCQAPLFSFKGASGVVTAVAFSPDGRHLAVGSGRAQSHDFGERYFGVVDDPVIELIDIPTGRRVRRFEGHKEKTSDLAFSPDGGTLYACGGHHERPGNGELHAWDTTSGKLIWRAPGKLATVWRLALSHSGNTLAFATGNTCQLWNLTTKKRIKTISCDEPVYSVAFGPDGRRLAVGLKSSVRVFENGTGKQLAKFTDLPGREMRTIDWHPSAERLVLGCYNGTGFLLDPVTGKADVLLVQEGDVHRSVAR